MPSPALEKVVTDLDPSPSTSTSSSPPAPSPIISTVILRTHDFGGLLPVPRRLQWDPINNPVRFTIALNALFGFAATFTVSNLYYCQPVLVVLALEFKVPYEEVVSIPTLVQAGYACGLLLITPCGDLLRRRELILGLVALAGVLVLSLAFVPLAGFQVLSFFLGLVSVTPQVLLPLAGDLAPPDKRAGAIAIVLSGLLFGILFARLLGGMIAEFGSVNIIWYLSCGLQGVIFTSLYFFLPDYPRKVKDITYFGILRSMAVYAVTEPVLVQSCLIGGFSSAIFASFWVSSTFLLSEVYGYNSLQIGLFALIGMLGVALAPFIGRAIDKLLSWTGILIGISIILVAQVIYTTSADLSIVSVAIVIFLIDIGQQTQQVSNSSRIFAINANARSRLSAVYIFSIFCGQLIGTAGGTRLYLAGGNHAAGGLSLGFLAWMYFVLGMRGPQLPSNRWIGWDGGWEMRKGVAEEKKRISDEEKAAGEMAERVNRIETEEIEKEKKNTI